MKKGLFTGWQDVFAFTFHQDTKGRFRKSTTVMAIIMLLVGMAISIIIAFVQKKNSEEVSPIQVVHIVNESDLELVTPEQSDMRNATAFPEVTFVTETKNAENLVGELEERTKDIILKISNAQEGYNMSLILPLNSEITEGQGDDFLKAFSGLIENAKLFASGIPVENLSIAMSGVNVTSKDAGEPEKSIGERMVTIFLPMIFVLVMYLFTLLYGMTMGNAVSVEKTSKLMEMMLTMTKPYALILGKILALTAAAVIQLLTWFASFCVGFLLGDYVAKTYVYPEYNNMLLEAFALLKKQNIGSAFSTGAFVLVVIAICIGILFFCLMAATFGSFATKTEEIAQYMGYYQLIVVAGFFGAYFIPMQEKPWLTGLFRLVPFCSAFLLPGDILVGNVTLLQGGLYILLLAAFTIMLVLIAGRVYRNQLFHRGEKAFARKRKN